MIKTKKCWNFDLGSLMQESTRRSRQAGQAWRRQHADLLGVVFFYHDKFFGVTGFSFNLYGTFALYPLGGTFQRIGR